MSAKVLERAKELIVPPPPGSPYSVPLLGSDQKDRTPIYRHWRMVDSALIDTLDPHVLTNHEMFESIGMSYYRELAVYIPFEP